MASARLCKSGVDSTNLKAICNLPFSITKDTKLNIFQYKIIHNILPHGSLLHKMKITDSPLCKHCSAVETLPHMLVCCDVIHHFWLKAVDWWNQQSGDNYSVNDLNILYGYNPETRKTNSFNYYILLGKRYIYLQRLQFKAPNLCQFLDLVKNKILVLRSIFQSKAQIEKFYSVWKPLLSLI